VRKGMGEVSRAQEGRVLQRDKSIKNDPEKGEGVMILGSLDVREGLSNKSGLKPNAQSIWGRTTST